MTPAAKNLEAIARAKTLHSEKCLQPPHTIAMHPYDIDRLGWAAGDEIAGMTLEADDRIQLDHFWLVCDATPDSPRSIEKELELVAG